MVTDITSIRLPSKDAIMVEHFVEMGEFKSKSEFIRYAIKKTINEMILREFHESISEEMTEDDVKNIQKEIKKIRRDLWDDYAKHLS
jgi:Arc/MetJ-type ribon-helix-helix transcriptional regulator